MKDDGETHRELTHEIIELRRQVAALEAQLPGTKSADDVEARYVVEQTSLERVLLDLSRLDKTDFEKSLQILLLRDAETLRVERVSFWWVAEDFGSITCERLFVLSESRFVYDKQKIGAEQFPRYMEALAQQRSIVAHNAQEDERTQEISEVYLKPLGITSMLDIPVWSAGKIVGIVCHEHIGPKRVWSPSEREFARTIGEMIAVSLEASERRQAEDALRESARTLQSILTASPVAIAMGKDRKIKWVNEAWVRMFGIENEYEHLEQDTKVLYSSEYEYERVGEAIYQGLEAGGVSESDVQLARKDGSVFQAHMRMTLFDPSDPKRGVIVACSDISARKKAEDDLAKARALLSAAIERSPAGIVIADAPDGKIRLANSAALGLMGESSQLFTDIPAEHHPDTWQAFHPDGTPFQPEDLPLSQAVLYGNTSRNVDVIIRRQDGEDRWVLGNAAPVHDSAGNIVAGVAVFPDITELKRAEQGLRESEEKFSKAFQNNSAAMAISTLEDGSFIEVNESFLRIFEYGRDEVIGKSSLDLGIWVDIRDREAMQRIAEKEGFVRNLKVTFQTKYRNVRHGLFSVDIIHLKNRAHLLSVMNDITEQKQAEEALRESEARFRKIYDQAPVMMHYIDQERIIRNVNSKWLLEMGYSRDKVLGRKIDEFMTDQSRESLLESLSTFWNHGTVKDVHYQYIKSDASLMEAMLDSVVTSDPVWGKVSLSTVRDITREVSLQKQLLQAQKMEAVGTLAGGIAHDFNNLLQVVQGYSELALLDIGEGNPGHSELLQIRSAAVTAGELTQGLLTFSRSVESKLRPVKLNHELKHVAKMLQRTLPKMITIDLRLADHLHTINADPAQLQQVALNLAVNARDAMPEGGDLLIQTRNMRLDEEYCKSQIGAKPGDYVMLAVSDTGSGMEKDIVDQVFDPFFTTKKQGEGTGLGLSIVYGIVKSHGGNIICYSEPNLGTTFKVYLPALQTERRSVESTQKAIPTGGHETILLADDESAVRNLGEKILRRFGYSVLVANNGREGLQTYMREWQKISLVILDLIMPEMSGAECLREILNFNPSAKVIIASGYASNGQIDDAVQQGAKASMRKPYETREMLELVRQTLDSE